MMTLYSVKIFSSFFFSFELKNMYSDQEYLTFICFYYHAFNQNKNNNKFLKQKGNFWKFVTKNELLRYIWFENWKRRILFKACYLILVDMIMFSISQ